MRMRWGMKRGLIDAALLVAITVAVSGCGGSRRLPAPLLKFIRSGDNKDVTGKTAAVYGPGSRWAIEQAAMGDLLPKNAAERSGFYLIVLHGHFESGGGVGGTKPRRHYKLLENVWSAKEGVTDLGVTDRLPATMARLGRPTLVALKR